MPPHLPAVKSEEPVDRSTQTNCLNLDSETKGLHTVTSPLLLGRPKVWGFQLRMQNEQINRPEGPGVLALKGDLKSYSMQLETSYIIWLFSIL